MGRIHFPIVRGGEEHTFLIEEEVRGITPVFPRCEKLGVAFFDGPYAYVHAKCRTRHGEQRWRFLTPQGMIDKIKIHALGREGAKGRDSRLHP